MIPTSEQVKDARELLRRFLTPTRLTPAERIGRDSDTQIYLKLETELPTRSFKPRGALYALMKNQEQRSIKGVVAASTGNHGAAVAYAARLAKLPATIFLPQSPNPIKRARIVSLGAAVQEVESKGQSLANAAASFAEEHGYYFLNDASDEFVPVGTATIAAEILDELPTPDVMIVPMGDTALIRGVASEAKRRHPDVKIVGVQAAQAPSYFRSWHENRVVTTETCDTIADGLATCVPLDPNVRAIRELVDEVCLVSENELLQGIRALLFDEQLVAEAAGAAATAAFLQNPSAFAGRSVVLLVTGSNIPNELLRAAANLQSHDP
ncbi:MAG TPA: pyridoxal-phosphate dependent enzyme [Pyrinomonadaceae bacterium]|nr:pyridoxal-phosphate dependent enzyme [Pyrinomonadaceae bacterium]